VGRLLVHSDGTGLHNRPGHRMERRSSSSAPLFREQRSSATFGRSTPTAATRSSWRAALARHAADLAASRLSQSALSLGRLAVSRIGAALLRVLPVTALRRRPNSTPRAHRSPLREAEPIDRTGGTRRYRVSPVLRRRRNSCSAASASERSRADDAEADDTGSNPVGA